MPRTKPKAVTPIEVPDDVMAALEERSPSPADPRDVSPLEHDDGSDDRRSLADVRAELVPLADQLRATIADIGLIPVARATPVQRLELVELRQRLDRARGDLSTWVDAIDIGFRRAAIETGAKEFTLDGGGLVTVEPPRGEWVVNVPALAAELKELMAHGLLSQDEFDAVFTTEVVTKANGSRLNVLATKRGTDMAEAVNRNRVWKAGDPASAKVRVVGVEA